MGTKYSSTAVVSYNSAPPSDDASTASTNQVKWSTIKGKLSDPLNTFASAVNSALVTAFDYSMRSVTSADSTVAGDHMRTLQVPSTVTTTFTISLGDAATMANGYIVRIRNSGQIGITIGRATAGDTLDGAASNKLLPPGATGIYAVNASANGYVTLSYAGPVQDTDAIVAGGTDGTKKVRLEVDGLTTGTTRVLTVPDFDGTIATLAGTETLTNKTLTSPTINTAAAGGAWTAASTWTLPAFTLGGAVTGNGQNISGLGTLGAGATTVTTLTATAGVTITGNNGGSRSIDATGAAINPRIRAYDTSTGLASLEAANAVGSAALYIDNNAGGLTGVANQECLLAGHTLRVYAGGQYTNYIGFNGTDITKNGTAYTNPDYVLEHWATGAVVKYAGKDGARDYDGLRPLVDVEAFARANFHLPRFGQDAGHGIFSGSDALLASVEEAYLYLFELNKRIAALEARLQ